MRCPVHGGRSLVIKEGDRARLMKCWGCEAPPETILAAVGLELKDLFDDSDRDPQLWQEQKRQRECERAKRKHQNHRDGLRNDTLREAEKVIQAARGIDINTLSDAQLDTIMDRLADAYGVLEGEQSNGT